MRKATRFLAFTTLALIGFEVSAAGPPFARNTAPSGTHVPLAPTGNVNGGLAPSTWGFAAAYSGTLYGTGYYAFKVDQTYIGTNSIYGYTFNYPTFGLVNDIRAVYVFDVSGLGGQSSPVWSGFLFDTRERPLTGRLGGTAFLEVNLFSSGGNHHLQGVGSFFGNNAANLDIYDAEDFENDAPFDHPELAFIGANNTLIGAVPVNPDSVNLIDFDVTNAVLNDLAVVGGGPPLVEVPALDTVGLAVLVLLLAMAGAILLRR